MLCLLPVFSPLPTLETELLEWWYSGALSSLSVGDPSVKLDIDDERFIVEDTLKVLGYSSSRTSPSSTGKHVSTIASKQLTNSSALSRFDW